MPAPPAVRSTDPSPSTTQVLLVGDREGPADGHPALQSWLDRDWTIARTTRRRIAGVGTKLFVVLSR